MRGKDKCRILKEIRAEIAQKNDIEWVVSECSHKGECRGTCPKCESEVRKLERELELRRKLGKAVALTGVSAACMAGLSACSLEDVVDCATDAMYRVKTLIGIGNANGNMEILEGEETYIPDNTWIAGQQIPNQGLGLFTQPEGTDKPIEIITEPETVEPETEEPYLLDGDVAVIDEFELSGYVPYEEETTQYCDVNEPDVRYPDENVFVTEGEVALDGDW